MRALPLAEPLAGRARHRQGSDPVYRGCGTAGLPSSQDKGTGEMSGTLTLGQRLDSTAASSLTTDLIAAMGAPMTLDASGVTFCGTLVMQTLLAARQQWQQDGQDFAVAAPSAEMLEACRLLGVTPDQIGITSEDMGEST